jgi:NTF2 fold immunity protein
MRVLASSALWLTCYFTATALADDELYKRAAEIDVRDVLEHPSRPSEPGGGLIVSNAAVAIAIHEAIASAAYGREVIEKERPFHAVRVADFWWVCGSMPKGFLGGVAISVIRARDGQVMRLSHPQ